MKQLACADMGASDCDFVARGATDDEVIKRAQEHARKAHPEMMNGMKENEMAAMMKSKIKEEVKA